MRFSLAEWIAGTLTVVGALNWGLVGLFRFNLVHTLFGWSKPLERFIYGTVGLAGLLFSLSLFASTRTTGRMIERVEERRPVGVV